ncbi:MAG: alanine/glycine:cation symporter family protein [Mobilicoccus sp.]|nr:alanine/glycine:cation symporter family protein [Mobilicoccus sp.]
MMVVGVNEIVEWIAGRLWSNPLVYFVLASGVLFTVALRAAQVTRLPDMIRQLVRGGDSTRGVSSFQAFAMALGGRVGVGNIMGVATAIHFGGPGAMFWMWVTAILGSAIAIVESSLAQVYKREINGEYRGGPAYYMEMGIGWKPLGKALAVVYAVAAIIAFTLTGPTIQANSIAASVENAWGVTPWITGVVVAVLFALVIFGGMKRIGQVCGILVPFMAIAYILLGLVVLALDAAAVPEMFRLIFSSAFGGEAMFGGMLGAIIMWGVRRAVYSSEAGTGSGAQASAAAEVSHPVKQGLVQGFSVYVDTLFVCTITGLMILVTGRYNVVGPNDQEIITNLPGEGHAVYTQSAIDAVFPGFGAAFVAIAMFLFAFTTLLAFGFYADTNVAYLFKGGRIETVAVKVAQGLLAVMIVVGAIRETTFAWNMADIGVGLYTWINLFAMLFLVRKAMQLFGDYVRQRRSGADPVFRPDAIGFADAELWNTIADRYDRSDEATMGEHRRDATS